MTLEGSGYTRHEYTGRVRGNAIEGTVRISSPREGDDNELENKVLPWRAVRTQDSTYFVPTGTAAK
jgi:hypothetical protein